MPHCGHVSQLFLAVRAYNVRQMRGVSPYGFSVAHTDSVASIKEEVASESRADATALRRLSCRVRISARLARLQTRDV